MTNRYVTAVTALTCALTTAAAPAHASSGPAHDGTLSAAQRKVLIDATTRFKDVDEAIAAGYLPTDHCVPGMGWHYVNPTLAADTVIDPVRPEVLLYTPGRNGTVRLVGIEYFKADADGRLTTDTDRPTLFGHRFDGPMNGHEVPPGTPPMPVHYDLHVWLYLTNPAGQLATENDRIICP
ncbi:hypothetical protein Q0Z83_031160 [Actinoplanes sichuanensis]|uniref:LppP/LprE family lipoprotein n=1 Tax=Actinoplanes sichuanensis TaxID=512349 RepID=A0ABW4ASC5_9ACTN|nr:hypothetical protein [Actinoplanes sichuanensis]BEL04925.1 hypothetical protein Q0Z83_031160 [Actinoplanes sichuanensis]